MLPKHSLKVVLVEPEIPQNAGNVGRLCAAVGAQLHLVRPLGFFLTDRHFKRAGMDYLKSLEMVVHDNLSSLMLKVGGDPIVLTSGLGGRSLWEEGGGRIAANTWIFMGKESAGLPADLLKAYPNSVYQIPMLPGTRGLNVSTAAGVVVYEALRQLKKSEARSQ
ncbi:MAG: tRNA (cytidine(34)-2'-O)-methyltransferase [Phycisphaerales bacterium]|nr:tRNA (cytidine(34)-2'-O)-methyltransferase [Phycisphaerales bacterium]